MESNVSTKELYDLGDQPPLGEVPTKMHAFMVCLLNTSDAADE